MTLFDLIALALIAISALMGFRNGAVRELVGLFAFGLSAIATLAFLPVSVRIAGSIFPVHIVAIAAAVIVGFAVVYISLKMVGGWISAQLHQQAILGGADRSLGLGIGAARALVLLGLFALVFDRATPIELKPQWITGALLYPLASASGRLVGALAPAGMRMISNPASLLNRGDIPDRGQTNETGAPPTSTKPLPAPPRRHTGKGYDRKSRDQLDSLVERTR